MITGILPCAGTSSRLDGLPKFLLPTRDYYLLGYHVRWLFASLCEHVWIGATKQNAAFLKPFLDPRATLKGTLNTATMCETVLAARSYCADDYVVMGMPDTYFELDTYAKMIVRLTDFNWPVVAACWRIRDDQRGKLGQCDVRSEFLRRVVDKDPTCDYPLAWGAIAWQPAFWEYIKPETANMGLALQAAIDAGVPVRAIEIDGEYYDCGTRDEYFRLCSTWVKEARHA